MGLCGRNYKICSLFSFGSIFTIVGLVLALPWGSVYDYILKKELVLTNVSQSYDLWKETPIPMYLSVYIFNWTNANEVLEKKWTVKPELIECGPYVLSEHHIRVNITWNDNGTVSYQQKRIWHFMPELSNGTLNDTITNLNPIVTIAGKKLKTMNPVIREIANLALKGFEHRLVLTKTVDELMFTGYEDPILHTLSSIIPELGIPSKFGWFYDRNNSVTFDGNYTIFTGQDDLNQLGMLVLWNGKNKTDYYEGVCSQINGSATEIWPPVTNKQAIPIFISDICSTVTVSHQGEEIINGITSKLYVGGDYAFDNGTKYPEQTCYQGERQVPSGLRDISKCRFGAPAFISYPHFYLADPSYLTTIIGLHPNKTIHESRLSIEAHSGIPMHIQVQIQISLFVEPIRFMSMFENIKPTYMPMMWFRQSAVLTDQYTKLVKTLLVLRYLGLYIGWVIFGIGIVLLLSGLFVLGIGRFFWCNCNTCCLYSYVQVPNSKDSEQLVNEEQEYT